MHVRLLPCIGMPVVENDTEEFLGELGGVLIDPDVGKIEGIFIQVNGFMSGEEYFCSSFDIVRFGTRVSVRTADAVSPASEFLRLQSLFADPRTVLGQRIRTESGRTIGRCDDIQFDTDSFHMEWIFPRKFWRWGIALPVSDILEVTPEAIVVRESLVAEPKSIASEEEEPVMELTETNPATRTGNSQT